MFRKLATAGLASLALGTAALAAVSLAAPDSASAFDGRWERERERPAYGWRPPPPVVHGFWGQRFWRRYSDDAPPRYMRPSPRHYESYGYGWR